MRKYMLDTNIFNRILDGAAPLASLSGPLAVTHIQRDEINNTKDPARREALLRVFSETVGSSVPTNSFVFDESRLGEARLSEPAPVATTSAVWGVSRWSEAKWTDAGTLVPALRSDLDALERKPNNIRDALIAETAIREGFTLVTDDANLTTVTRKYLGTCLSFDEWTSVDAAAT